MSISRVAQVAGAHFRWDFRLVRVTRSLVVVRARFATPFLLLLEDSDVV